MLDAITSGDVERGQCEMKHLVCIASPCLPLGDDHVLAPIFSLLNSTCKQEMLFGRKNIIAG